MRIRHIGSTSVPGLAAKDVIDLQVSVADLEPFEPLRSAIQSLGYEWMPGNDDHRKRFFQLDSRQRVRLANLHVRRLGEYSEQAAVASSSSGHAFDHLCDQLNALFGGHTDVASQRQ